VFIRLNLKKPLVAYNPQIIAEIITKATKRIIVIGSYKALKVTI